MARNEQILIIGNGPSTRDLAAIGFENLRPDLDTFGMGIAYRYFRVAKWWPTYYGLGDSKVVFSHRHALGQVVEDSEVTTERFFFSWPVSEHPRFELIKHSSTGDFCFRKALELGYKKIYLIGIEGHYVEEILESRPVASDEFEQIGFDELNLSEAHRKTLRVITHTPEVNPNYFFRGYQAEGDVYSLPQGNRHRERWKDVVAELGTDQVQVLNLSEFSKIDDFPKATLQASREDIFQSAPGSGNAAEDLARELLIERSSPADQSGAPAAFWYGPFDRDEGLRVEEAGIALDLPAYALPAIDGRSPVMVDVGACKGGAFRDYASAGWTIHAFEPNPELHDGLSEQAKAPNVFLNHSAVSDVEGDEIPFYTSDESIGISTLKAFRESHVETARVKTVRLDNYLRAQGIDRIDFLKIDTEGFDFPVLKGLDFTACSVDIIVCEFEDRKSLPLGYSVVDMADFLVDKGYTVYVSEWHPIIRYGIRHQWRAVKQYPCQLEETDAWGNLVAFKSDPGICAVASALKTSMRRFEKKPSAQAKTKQATQERAKSKPAEKRPSRVLPTPYSEQPATTAAESVERSADLARESADLAREPADLAREPADLAREPADLGRERELLSKLTESRDRVHTLQTKLAQRREQVAALEAELASVYTSTSWRLTAPIRKLKQALMRSEK